MSVQILAHLDSVGSSTVGADHFGRNNRFLGLYRMLMCSQEVDGFPFDNGNFSHLIMETVAGSGKFVACRLRGVNIVIVPNSVFDSRLHAHAGVQLEAWSFTGPIHLDMG